MKGANNYRSIIHGVSEQAPELRPEGQLTEQVNVIPDPIEGLSRRFGSLWQTEATVAVADVSAIAAFRADTNSWRTFDYFSKGTDYTVMLRRAARPAGSDLPAMIVYDRTNKVFLPVVRNVTDAALDTFAAGGASAITNIGRFVFMAGNTLTPTNTPTDVWGSNSNLSKAVVWIRGGAYARTFKVTATKLDNSTVTFQYTTPLSQYPQSLDTSGVPVWIPDAPAAGTVPTTLTIREDTGYVSPTAGQTFTLAHTPSGPTTVSSFFLAGDTGDLSFYGVDGLDYSIVGTTLTFLRNIGSQAEIFITYQYAPGGTSTGLTYTTEASTDAAYIRRDGSYGVTELNFKDWKPSALTAYNGVQAMTNSYPALPANSNQYSWNAGQGKVTFHESLINALTVNIAYTHIKVVLNPNYAKQVNDVTNAYNTAVTKWIGDAAEAIEPQNIAEQLRLVAVAAGLTSATRSASTIIFDNVKALTVDDGGDGSLIRGVADEVASVDGVSTIHYVGKVVKVRGKNSKESFYLKATAKDKTVTSGVTEIIWVEGAGVTFALDAKLIFATVNSGTFYVASTAALLDTITGLTGDDAAPTYGVNEAGDGDTNPVPFFVGRKITWLSMFQDRLLVGSGGVVRASRTSDYLNFWRSTVLTLPANDAVEFLAKGAEDDELRFDTLYDKNLIIFGLKRQYVINGNAPLTPTNANMTTLSSHANAADMPPLEAGGLIFYAKRGISSSSVHQIQPALSGSQSPDSFNVSSQIDLYLRGTAIEFQQIAKPSTLFLRTQGRRNSIYCFSYLDTQEGRKQDAWHRWDYDDALGPIIGMQPTPEGLLVFSLRTALTAAAVPKLYVVADLQPMTTGLSTLPYMDSLRTLANATSVSTRSINTATVGAAFQAAFDTSTEWKFIGDLYERRAQLALDYPSATGLWVGVKQEAYFTPTNPFVRDQSGKANTIGRLTVTSMLPTFKRSSGYSYDITFQNVQQSFEFNGRLAGDPNNLVGRIPVTNFQKAIIVGREASEFNLTIRALKWYPFTVSTLAWVGQYFNRTRPI